MAVREEEEVIVRKMGYKGAMELNKVRVKLICSGDREFPGANPRE